MAKIALLIGVSDYEPDFDPLPGSAQDIVAMQAILQHPEMGGFDQVTPLPNPTPQEFREAVETLFTNRSKDDLLLLYFSGHGITDDMGNLYLATRVTRKQQLMSTAVDANFIHRVMGNSRCRRQVVILDSCFSGAFAKGMTMKAGDPINLQAQLGGEGRAILTSSSALEYSFQRPEDTLSLYTRFIVEGIQTGAADQDGDGSITVDELHKYARAKVQDVAPAMKPEIYAAKEGYDIHLANAPVGDPHLEYRKEVETLARDNNGDLSDPLDRGILDALRLRLQLAPEDTAQIEAQVVTPYRERQAKLNHYTQTFQQATQREYPLSEKTRSKLQRLQQILRLQDTDTLPLEQPILAQAQAAYEVRQRQEAERLHQQAAEQQRQKLERQQAADQQRREAEQQRQREAERLRQQDAERQRQEAERQQEADRQRQEAAQRQPSPVQTQRQQQTTSTLDPMTRRRVLQWAGWGGAGLAVAVVGNGIRQQVVNNSSSSNPPSPAKSPESRISAPVPLSLQTVEFKVVTVDATGKQAASTTKTAPQFVEDLGNGINLEMVQIPGGSFQMGTPSNQRDTLINEFTRYGISKEDAERWLNLEMPQHQVAVPAFFMGKTPVTQAQYQAIMGKNPSSFKGANRPVETVEWSDAMEFCQRLSKKTGKAYRLPSEAEWEYACRAGTTTPFYFGATITLDLVNYNGNYPYGNAPKGKFREQTTDVGSFPPNAFGLYDCHGNVYEWCADNWHNNYNQAPTDGSIWKTKDFNNDPHMLRGGSWLHGAVYCRSAHRRWFDFGSFFNDAGFRVVVSSAPRT